MTQVEFPKRQQRKRTSQGRERLRWLPEGSVRLRHMLCYHAYEKLCRSSNKCFLMKYKSLQCRNGSTPTFNC